MSHPRFLLFRSPRNRQFYFNLTAKNGRIILQSEEHRSKQGARNGIKSVKANAKRKNRYERRTAKNGKYYFVLESPNGRTIGMSEMYNTYSGRAIGMRSVAANAGRAKVTDES